MNNSRYVLAFDPSGNYNEGKGTTGWCLMDLNTKKICKFGYISASSCADQYEYWDKHIDLIDGLTGFKPDIVLEDYLLYGNSAMPQINSRLETPQLLGVIKYEAYKRGLPVAVQTAMQVKTRWSDAVLVKKGYINPHGRGYMRADVPVSDHVRDAMRHAVHYATYGTKYKGDY